VRRCSRFSVTMGLRASLLLVAVLQTEGDPSAEHSLRRGLAMEDGAWLAAWQRKTAGNQEETRKTFGVLCLVPPYAPELLHRPDPETQGASIQSKGKRSFSLLLAVPFAPSGPTSLQYFRHRPVERSREHQDENYCTDAGPEGDGCRSRAVVASLAAASTRVARQSRAAQR